MGKAFITGGGENGIYSAELIYDAAYLNALLEHMRQQIEWFQSKLPEYADKPSLYRQIQMRIHSLTKDRGYLLLQKVERVAMPIISCADFTEDLSGFVGTCEVPGEPWAVKIRPGFGGAAAYNEDRDGGLVHPASMPTPAALYSFAIHPGWMKYRPLWRFGTIESFNRNQALITLEDHRSSYDQLPLNQAATLDAVPIEYMDCDQNAFDAGDQALIEFTDQEWESPRVIGFRGSPRACRFWVKPTINGNTVGAGLRLRVVYTGGETSEALTDAGGVAGPFPRKDALNVELHDTRAQRQDVFAYYQQVPEGDHEIAFKWAVQDCGSMGLGWDPAHKGGFYTNLAAVGDIDDRGPWYLKRIQWQRAQALVGNMATTWAALASGREVEAVSCDFTCRVLKRSFRYRNFYTAPNSCGCNPAGDFNAWTDTWVDTMATASCDFTGQCFYGWEIIPEPYWCEHIAGQYDVWECPAQNGYTWQWEEIAPRAGDYSFSQPAILTDALGQAAPVFTDGYIKANFRLRFAVYDCWKDEGGCFDPDIICALTEPTDFIWRETAFAMVETPILNYA